MLKKTIAEMNTSELEPQISLAMSHRSNKPKRKV
jgi:hypothetical protein